MVVFPFPTSFYGNDGTKFPEKSAFDPRSVVVNNAGTMKRKLSGQKLAVLGAGKLGGIFLRAYLKQWLFSPKRVSATALHGDKAATLSKDLGVGVTSDNRKGVAGADIVLLCVKPQVIREVLEEIRPHVLPTRPVAWYSIVALAGTEIVLQNFLLSRAATGISPADVFGG
jgi:F420-dependent NADP oxidoreductase-like protein